MKRQSGFTLIELIMVIVILGILAATALPRFADLGVDARVAKAQGALGSVKSAATIAHATQLAQGLNPASSVTIEGNVITMTDGYPTANAAGIGVAAGGLADYTLSGGGAGAGAVLTIATDVDHAACSITYTAPAAANTSPGFSTAPARANC